MPAWQNGKQLGRNRYSGTALWRRAGSRAAGQKEDSADIETPGLVVGSR